MRELCFVLVLFTLLAAVCLGDEVDLQTMLRSLTIKQHNGPLVGVSRIRRIPQGADEVVRPCPSPLVKSSCDLLMTLMNFEFIARVVKIVKGKLWVYVVYTPTNFILEGLKSLDVSLDC